MSTPTIPVEGADLIRQFPVSSLRESIDRALATIPEGKHVAAIAFAEAQGGQMRARLAVMARIGGDWSCMGVLEKPWSGKLRAEAALVWSR